MRPHADLMLKGILAMMTMAGDGIVCGAETGALADAATTPIRIGSRKQLFVDDVIIESMENLATRIHPARKHPRNPVLVADRSWERKGQLIIYGSVLHEPAEPLFKMWYWCDGRGAYALSRNGIEWEKPELELVEFEGTTRNNLVPWMALGMVHSPDDPDPNRRYKSLLGRQGAFSADGLTWQVPPESRNIPGDIASDNVIPFCYDEQSERYVAFPKVVRESGGHLRRSVSVSFSTDFLTWTPAQTILVPDARDDRLARAAVAALRDRVEYDDGPEWHLAQFYGHCGFPYEGIYLGLLWVFDISGWGPPLWGQTDFVRRPGAGGEDGPVYVQLTSSRDLVNWQRVGERQPFLPLGPAGSHDAGQIYTVNRPLIVGDEIWIYYSGATCTHGHPKYWATEGDHYPRIAEALDRATPATADTINLATLRLDRWVSVDGGQDKGTLTTKPISFTGKRLVINADARGGAVAAELLNAAGDPIPGFGRDNCRPFRGDSVRHVLKWRDGSNLGSLQDTPVRLRFILTNAKLYSFVFRP